MVSFEPGRYRDLALAAASEAAAFFLYPDIDSPTVLE